jgi:hypothetical protein
MLNAIWDSLSNHTSSEDEVDGDGKEDGEHEDDDEEDTGHGTLSEEHEPGRVRGTIAKTVQHRMESFWWK